MRLPLLCLFVIVALFGSARAGEPFFKKNDVIALVGGEDMVVASEYGYLETLLTRALPDFHLRFRNLAWEGDTVYEQHRDLNFPTCEEALDKIGATVVICQFGQMESLDGKDKIPEFIAAYQKLLERFSGGGKRRIVLVTPHETEFHQTEDSPVSIPNRDDPSAYADAIAALGRDSKMPCLHYSIHTKPEGWKTRDGLHLDAAGQFAVAMFLRSLTTPKETAISFDYENGRMRDPNEAQLASLIVAKNKLWFDYWRVENWAFLFGDRTNQPSSRDHRDPSKRWFPAEREEFIPLIEAKEKEIDAVAAKLNQK